MESPLDLEQELNRAKSKLSKIDFPKLRSNSEYELGFRQIRDWVSEQNNGQRPSKGWLKMWEMLNLEMVQNFIENQTSINGFFNAELPGSFLLATNHYLRTFYPKKEFNWVASSYLGSKEDSLADDYELFKRNPKNVLVGTKTIESEGQVRQIEVNGDLLTRNKAIGLSKLAQLTIQKLSSAKSYNFYSSDGGFDIGQKFGKQEELHIPLKFGEALAGLYYLEKGGMFILKLYTLFTEEMTNLAMILMYAFENYDFFKPFFSSSLNSEVYFVGVGYKGFSVMEDKLELLDPEYPQEQELKLDIPAYQDDLITQVRSLTNQQIKTINWFVKDKGKTPIEDYPNYDLVLDDLDEMKRLQTKDKINIKPVKPRK